MAGVGWCRGLFVREEFGGRSGRRRLYIFVCDQCGVEYVGRPERVRSAHQFCSRVCNFESLRSGARHAALKGKPNPFKAYCEQMGVDNAAQLPDVREKVAATNLERYGSRSYMSSDDFRSKNRTTCLERYGAPTYVESDEFKAKATETCTGRYGSSCFMASDAFKALRKHINYSRCAAKRHATMKASGAYARQSSAAEDALYAALCDVFGSAAVERHVEVDGRDIDMYVEPLDLYVALDGVYYHGLDRPLEVIAEHRTATDVTIHGTYGRDRRQDAYFEANRMLLLRVTDRDDPHAVAAALLGASIGSEGVEHAPGRDGMVEGSQVAVETE